MLGIHSDLLSRARRIHIRNVSPSALIAELQADLERCFLWQPARENIPHGGRAANQTVPCWDLDYCSMSLTKQVPLPKIQPDQRSLTRPGLAKPPSPLKLTSRLPQQQSGPRLGQQTPPPVAKTKNPSPAVKQSPEGKQTERTTDLPVEVWRIDALTDHPLHAVHFPALTEAELQEIAVSMQNHGQRDPIHILPDGVILDGRHRRWAAMKIGWTEVKVVVHHELAEASEEAIEAFLIDCNASRRQLSRLQQARLYLRRRELQPRGVLRRGQGELRDELVQRFAMSGRNLDRYVALLRHPPELQSAVEAEEVSLIKALRLMKLPPTKHRPILAKLRKGESVKKEVNKLLLYVPQEMQLSDEQLIRLLRDFIRSGFDVESHFDAIAPLLLPQHRQKLLDLGKLVLRLESQIVEENCGADSPE